MTPLINDEVTVYLRNGFQVSGKVIEWDDVNRSIDREGDILMIQSKEDIFLILKKKTSTESKNINAPVPPITSSTKQPNEPLVDEESNQEEFVESDIKTLASMREQLINQEKTDFLKRAKSLDRQSGEVTVQYGLPRFVKK